MKSCVVSAMVLLGFLTLIAGIAPAQWDADGPNATLTINGTTPSVADATGHMVLTPVPGDFSVVVGGGANPAQGVILLTGPLNANTMPTPWGGNLDVGTPNPSPPFIPGSIAVVSDGISFSTGSPLDQFSITPFTLSVTVDYGFASTAGPGVQALVTDPTAPPFNFDNTEAGASDFQAIQIDVYANGPDDGAIQQNLNQTGFPAPVTVSMGGTAYTRFFVGTNGMITFSVPTGDFTPTLNECFNGFWPAATILPNANVCAAWGDLGRTTVLTDDITVIQYGATGVVEVQYNNQEHWGSQNPAGSWTVTFNTAGPGSIDFDHSNYIVGDPLVDAGPIVGISDGNDGVGTDRTSDLSADIAAAYLSAGTESIAEDFSGTGTLGGSLDISIWSAIDIVGNHTWLLN